MKEEMMNSNVRNEEEELQERLWSQKGYFIL